MKMANNTTKVEDAKRDIHLRVVIVRNNVVVITCWINVGDAGEDAPGARPSLAGAPTLRTYLGLVRTGRRPPRARHGAARCKILNEAQPLILSRK